MIAGTIALATDALLLEDVRRGQQAAFDALFQRYYPRIYQVLYRLVGDEADDLAQETFMRLYARPPENPATDLAAWLYQVATRLGYNALRSAQRQRAHRDLLGRLTGGSGWQPAEQDPENWTEERETARRVRETLAQLGQREATLLVLRTSGLSYAEIARTVGVSPGSVGTLLARAERAFERKYEAGGTK
jgi:RNA polymerase sigma-70 factor, ECF subfamily